MNAPIDQEFPPTERPCAVHFGKQGKANRFDSLREESQEGELDGARTRATLEGPDREPTEPPMILTLPAEGASQLASPPSRR